MEYTASEQRYETMKYRRVGKSGLLFPILSLGFWHNFGTNDNYENMKAMCFTAFDHGITQFDLANNYGPEYGSAESNLGRIMREELHAYRDELLITTKAGFDMWPGPYGDHGSRKYLIASLDQSLKRMGLEYVDIFYHHRMDPDTPLEETMGALDQIVKSGKGIISFSPLAQGMLTDRYLNGIPTDSRVMTDGRFLHKEQLGEDRISVIRKLNDLASKRGETLAQMALKWVVKDSDVTSVLIGASKPQQILENLKVMQAADFSDEELKLIDEIGRAHV